MRTIQQDKPSGWRALVSNAWLPACIAAAASCLVLVIQLVMRKPPLDGLSLRARFTLGVPAVLGSLAGLYGAVASVLMRLRSERMARLRAQIDDLHRHNEEIEKQHKAQRARLDELATLREVATIVNHESDFTIIAQKVLELVHGLLEPLEAAIMLRDDSGHKPRLRPFAQWADGKVMTGRKTLTRAIPAFALEDFESQSIVCRIHGQELHAILPLRVDEEVQGVLLLIFPTDARPAEEQIAEFNRLRRHALMQISHHMSLAAKTKHLHTRAVVDDLTQLYSRAHFDAQFEAHVELAQRTGEPLSLILVDIDHFKKVNDTHGHATGDVVLNRVAKRIQGKLRKYDSAYRYGGEELAVLLPRTSLKQAAATAERLRSTVEAQKIRGANGELLAVTVSLGVAQFEPDDTPESFFGRADERLYKAKQTGRNKVVAAT